jgi:2,4-dienoyl-CoA reductase (NADPH2)
MSLLPKEADRKTSSAVFDFVFGYGNRSMAMTEDEIEAAIDNFAQAARRAREAGCDGVEIAAHKGYLIHQFLNPGINRRKDAWGGSVDKRFRLLREVVLAVRKAVGDDYLVGVRMAAVDRNYLPLNVRLPVVFPLRHYFVGNGLKETLQYGRELKLLGIDFLHITSGFGFIHPSDSTGDWPVDEFRLFVNATRHLSGKAKARAIILNALPRSLVKLVGGIGWRYRPAANAEYARAFREVTGLPVIANGGFQERSRLEQALESGQCDLIAMARPLLANPDLISLYRQGVELPPKPCNHCNRCSAATAVLPLGCYNRERFASQAAMQNQIMWWSGGPLSQAAGIPAEV